jgi:small subunit ribosomal protein S6
MSQKHYEGVVVFAPELDEQALKSQIEKIESVIKAHDGAVERTDVWGRRELAFRMKKKGFGIYVVLVFNGDNKLIADLDRQLRINEAVLRHQMVIKDQFAPDLSANRRSEEVMGFESLGMQQGSDDDLGVDTAPGL